ncbi:hypothetical protein [Candidatus Enterovibrio escicola]|uniref:Mobile element protein n=1 Tax=Candidatus Enterovibrio escicola TaxID=1927127 RepID=A0A2A5T749_9GAMM|nr:hypothetical protein [Candidatus Enterovibrio escacola]PCS23991.1 Mobile element protein [Candidatus Enterovibrio escacola]
MLNPLRRKIQRVSANGAYDTRACHHVLKNKGITPNMPLPSNAGYWEEGYPENKAVKALKGDKQAQLKKDRGYHKCTLAETVMFRYNRVAQA